MDCEILILGGGPAGLAAAIYAGRAERKTIVLERALIGGQVASTMEIANYPGFPDGIDGPTLAERMREQAERFGVEFRTGEATRVLLYNDTFHVEGGEGTLVSRAVILATGSDLRPLGVPGEKEFRGRGVSYCGTCDAPFFRNQRVVVVGGGDTALKESLHIAKFARELTIIHRRDAFRGEKIYQRQIFASEKIRVVWDSVVEAIQGTKRVESVRVRNVKTGEVHDRACDGIFIFVGTLPNTSLVAHLFPSLPDGHIPTDLDMMTPIPGLFAAGDVREHSYRQVATAVGEGATAAIAADHYLARKDAS